MKESCAPAPTGRSIDRTRAEPPGEREGGDHRSERARHALALTVKESAHYTRDPRTDGRRSLVPGAC